MSTYTDFYYTNMLGYVPSKEAELKSDAIFKYLIDNDLSSQEIINIMLVIPQPAEIITPDLLPDYLWKDSLIKRNTFYYHHSLHITSKPPYFDIKKKCEIKEPYFLEMKIRYTESDLYKYYLINTNAPQLNDKRDLAALSSLVKKYDSLSFIQGLDFVLSLIDSCRYCQTKVLNVFDISKNEADVYEELKKKTAEARLKGKDLIRWRS